MKVTKVKVLVGAGLLLGILLGLGVWWWVARFHNYTPAEVVQDIRAGIAARKAPEPVERFLELRYGPLTEAENRRKAFLDFFNVGHIEGLQLLVAHMEPGERRTNVAAMATWVRNYRQTLSPADKAALAARFKTDGGRRMLQRATAQYLAQDVRYRAETSVVITELMATIAEVQKP
jgi:hypothetical protein